MTHILDGKPVWYVLSSEGWNGGAIVKHGTTFHVSRRKDPYATSNPYKVAYKRVFVLSQSSLDRLGVHLYALDSINFPAWLDKKGLAGTHCKLGGGNEFYIHPDPVALAHAFFADIGIVVTEEIDDDEQFPINGDVSTKVLLKEDKAREQIIKSREKPCLKRKADKAGFLDVFLPGGALRSHQEELWAEWMRILATQASYKGIVHWPTGTGKTYAMLLLLLLSAEKHFQEGKVFRGLLIAPQNSILDTLMTHIRKLSLFGIEVLEGHRGGFSGLTIPTDKPFLLVTTHASLTTPEAFLRLPPINHVHYDEVHRITGEEFFGLLTAKMAEWGTAYLTGTSATPKTSNKLQHEKIAQLFGEPATILHRAEMDDMVRRGYIAAPRFFISQTTLDSPEMMIACLVEEVKQLVIQRQSAGLWRGGKAIVYLDTLRLTQMAYETARLRLPKEWQFYAALDSIAPENSDSRFLTDKADGTPRILFACEKFREGADITGLEFTALLMGKTIAAYILLQMIGRALRSDYKEKEGWCLIMRPQYEDDGETTALQHILLDLEALIGCPSGTASRKDLAPFVNQYLGDVTINGRKLDLEETLTHVQNLYLRRALAPETSYKIAQMICLEHMIADSADYKIRQAKDLTALPADPATYYRGFGWKGWHEYLHGPLRSVNLEDFTKSVVRAQGVHTAEGWLGVQASYPEMPSLQQIHDGYFEGIKEFSEIVKRAQLRVGRR
jgi:superfamily II DNA or RNA helicase